MAELVDAPASGAGILTGVEVRVFSWAPKHQNPLQLDCKGFLLVCKGFRQPLRFLYQYSLSCRLLPVNPSHLRRQVPNSKQRFDSAKPTLSNVLCRFL